ncbi:MAG: nucleotidyltransferase domain-containing protein [Phascolarctobacterium sp.]|nr:nucleotidyltransferase domain-containing protein [Phascolarctobacterium sp.]
MKGCDAMCTQQALDKIAHELKTEALLLFPNIHKIILYGSYARGDNTPESDVDIMIIIDDSEDNVLKYRNQFSKIAALLGMKYDVLLSVLFRDKGNFYKRAQYNPFYKNIVKEGVEWYG